MTRRRASLSTWIEPGTLAHLRALSERSRVPQAAIVREVLPEALDEWERSRWPEDVGRRWLGEDEE